ncbi:MAG TPA: hypothetical protein VEC01_05210 [Noviherbaspirillum sp.]|uniref:hypothetical protein n=1 Tax=Noviherbaspirillum sp. TaxID=1926288 RepID=UPI002D2BEDD8|nr:hypothetical protein [Noviherbaspirillum sp.]HYD94704.1 hypothetical protein [Noviherbaspirillum sp.]
MPTFLQHRNINIVTLYNNDDVAEYCRPGDIALKQEGDHWRAYDIQDDGRIAAAGFPSESYDKALETAKATAERRAG